MTQRFVIDGINPVPWKAPTYSGRGSGAKRWVQVFKDEELVAYQGAIKEWFEENEALPLVGEDDRPILHTGPFKLEFYFFREGAVADATNLQKALEDALQGVLYKNDKTCIDVRSKSQPVVTGQRPLIVVDYMPGPEMLMDDEMELMYQQYARDVVVNDAGNRREGSDF